MLWITLRSARRVGIKLSINASNIAGIEEDGAGSCICTGNERHWYVQESRERILEIIHEERIKQAEKVSEGWRAIRRQREDAAQAKARVIKADTGTQP